MIVNFESCFSTCIKFTTYLLTDGRVNANSTLHFNTGRLPPLSAVISNLQYILIWQYVDTVNEYHDMILHLENRNTRNTLIEQSVTALLEYCYNTLLLIYSYLICFTHIILNNYIIMVNSLLVSISHNQFIIVLWYRIVSNFLSMGYVIHKMHCIAEH